MNTASQLELQSLVTSIERDAEKSKAPHQFIIGDDEPLKILRAITRTLFKYIPEADLPRVLAQLKATHFKVTIDSQIKDGKIKKQGSKTIVELGKRQANYLAFFLVIKDCLEQKLGKEGAFLGDLLIYTMYNFLVPRETRIQNKHKSPFSFLYSQLKEEQITIFNDVSVLEVGSDKNTIQQLGDLINIFGQFLYDNQEREDLSYDSNSFIKLSNWSKFGTNYDYVITANVISPYAVHYNGEDFHDASLNTARAAKFLSGAAEAMAAMANLTRKGGKCMHLNTYDQQHLSCLSNPDFLKMCGLTRQSNLGITCTGNGMIYHFVRTQSNPMTQEEFDRCQTTLELQKPSPAPKPKIIAS